MLLSSVKEIQKILDDYKISPKKGLGQNFLIDKNVVEHIIKSVFSCDSDKNNCILEIGPGLGVLSHQLAKNAGKLICIETDKDMINILENTLLPTYSNVLLEKCDFLKYDLSKLEFDKKITAVGNLPYYITTPIIEKIIDNRNLFSSLTIMIQKEVFKRMKALPGSKEYGALSVFIQYYMGIKLVCDVSKNCFYPAPKVDSCVVRLEVSNKPRVQVKDEKIFFQIVRSAFGKRRKTLLNALSNSTFLYWSKEKVLDVLKKSEIDPNLRGETLNLEEFAKIANNI